MQPDITMQAGTFNASGNLVEQEDAVARIYLSATDVGVANTYWKEATGSTDDIPAFTFFTGGYLAVNLFLTEVTFQLAEKSSVTPHFGDKFSIYYFGKSPIALQAVGFIINPYDDSHKVGLVSAYKHLLRLGAVATMGIGPYLSFLGYHVEGAMLNLKMSESASQEGIIQVNFDWLVTTLDIKSPDNTTELSNPGSGGPLMRTTIRY